MSESNENSPRCKEYPLRLTAEEVLAVLNGTKTQTRRVVKTVDLRHGAVGVRLHGTSHTVVMLHPDDGLTWRPHGGSPDVPYPYPERCSPYAGPGDQLWVRETWGTHWMFDDIKPSRLKNPKHGFDAPPPCRVVYRASEPDCTMVKRWRQSNHMPRWASRIQLGVTELRIERVQDISERDALDEGCNPTVTARGVVPARAAFAHLWDSTNAKRGNGWDANPWVWVSSFEVML